MFEGHDLNYGLFGSSIFALRVAVYFTHIICIGMILHHDWNQTGSHSRYLATQRGRDKRSSKLSHL